jgi:RNase adaptor protein for sRNA GlmZ degradation
MSNSNLKIDIHSFSYKKKGYPKDNTGNGGGFCFDCRGILNPGRIDEYKSQTGKDIGVIDYLETQTKMPDFIALAKQMVSISIEDYLSRNFDNLQINFGCTGGQHRSVYSAEKIAEYILQKYPQTTVCITHDEQPQLNQKNEA